MSRDQNRERWDTFLQKLRVRGKELIDAARDQALSMFIEAGSDPVPVSNALNGVRIQLLELCTKADDTWDQKVRDVMYDSGITDDALDREEAKRNQLRHSLESDYTLLEMEIRNQMAEHVMQLAAQQEVKTVSCTQCLARLAVPLNTYTSRHVVCPYCQTVNTYEPGTYQRMVEAYLHDIARWKAIEECKAEMELSYAVQQAGEGTRGKVKAAHRVAYKAYCERYLAELKALNPNTDVEKGLDFEMKRFDS